MAIIFEIFVFVLCVMLLNRNSSILHNFHQSNMKSLLLSFVAVLLLTVSFCGAFHCSGWWEKSDVWSCSIPPW